MQKIAFSQIFSNYHTNWNWFGTPDALFSPRRRSIRSLKGKNRRCPTMCLLGRERYAPEHRVVRVKNRQPIYRADGNRKNSRSKKDSKCGEYEKPNQSCCVTSHIPLPFPPQPARLSQKSTARQYTIRLMGLAARQIYRRLDTALVSIVPELEVPLY
jgi:hypothetical protein